MVRVPNTLFRNTFYGILRGLVLIKCVPSFFSSTELWELCSKLIAPPPTSQCLSWYCWDFGTNTLVCTEAPFAVAASDYILPCFPTCPLAQTVPQRGSKSKFCCLFWWKEDAGKLLKEEGKWHNSCSALKHLKLLVYHFRETTVL